MPCTQQETLLTVYPVVPAPGRPAGEASLWAQGQKDTRSPELLAWGFCLFSLKLYAYHASGSQPSRKDTHRTVCELQPLLTPIWGTRIHFFYLMSFPSPGTYLFFTLKLIITVY